MRRFGRAMVGFLCAFFCHRQASKNQRLWLLAGRMRSLREASARIFPKNNDFRLYFEKAEIFFGKCVFKLDPFILCFEDHSNDPTYHHHEIIKLVTSQYGQHQKSKPKQNEREALLSSHPAILGNKHHHCNNLRCLF